MKISKYYLIACLLIVQSTGILAQSLELRNIEMTQKEVRISDVVSTVDTKVDVFNVSNNRVSAQVIETGRQLAHNSMSVTYCWGDLCITTTGNEGASVAQPIEPKDKTELKISLNPQSHTGLSTVSYRVFSRSLDDLNVTFRMNVLPGGPSSVSQLVNLSSTPRLDRPYPNPSSTVAEVSYYIPRAFKTAYLRVSDLLGKEVGRYALEQNSDVVEVNVRSLKSGLYFCSLEVDQEIVATQRLLVK